jgi:hypothetical protein
MVKKIYGDEYFFLFKINEGLILDTGKGLTDKEKKLLKLNTFELNALKENGPLDQEKLRQLGLKSIEALRVAYENIKTKESGIGLDERVFWKKAVEHMFKCMEVGYTNAKSDEARLEILENSTSLAPLWVGIVCQWHRQYGEKQQREAAIQGLGCSPMIFILISGVVGLTYVIYKFIC